MLREPWRTRLLFVSFAANLLLVPIAASHFWPRRIPITPGVPPTAMIIDHMTRQLSPEDAARLRNIMEDHLGTIDAARVKMLAARGVMARAIARPPYDPEAVRTAMRNWQATWQSWSEALGEAMLEALPGLSDRGRQELGLAGRRRPG